MKGQFQALLLYLKNAIMFCLMTILILLLFEVSSYCIIRIVHFTINRPTQIERFEFHPFTTGKILQPIGGGKSWPNFDPVIGSLEKITTNTDQFGFRHNGNPNRKIMPGAFKIFILGGSTTWGVGVSRSDKTISAQLEKILEKKISNVQVINAGTSGYYSAQEFQRLIHHVLPFKPNLVISIAGVNDARHSYKDHSIIFPNRGGEFYLSDDHKFIYHKLRTELGEKEINEAELVRQIKKVFTSLSYVIKNKTYFGFLLLRLAESTGALDSNKQDPAKPKEVEGAASDILSRTEHVYNHWMNPEKERLWSNVLRGESDDFFRIVDQNIDNFVYYTLKFRTTELA